MMYFKKENKGKVEEERTPVKYYREEEIKWQTNLYLFYCLRKQSLIISPELAVLNLVIYVSQYSLISISLLSLTLRLYTGI